MSHPPDGSRLPRVRGRIPLSMAASGLVFALVLVVSVSLLSSTSGRAEAQESHGTLRPVTLEGLGNPDNYGFQRMYQFEGHLWTVAGNWNGAIIYRTKNGENWVPINPPGFDGSPENDSMATLAWFRGANDPPGSSGQLYAATYRFRGSGPFAGDIWRSPNALEEDPDDIVWEKVVERTELPEEWADVQAFVGFAPFKDQLYVATFVNNWPNDSGAEIFRTRTGDRGDWHIVTPNGMDDARCNTDFHWNIVFGDHLYFGSEEAGCVGYKGGEIWRTNGDDLTDGQRTLDGWEKVMAEPGFGHPWNNNIFGMDVFKGHFYGATWVWGGGMEVFRAPINYPHEGPNAVPFDFEQVSLSGVNGDPRNSVNVSMVHLGDTLYILGIDLAGVGNGYFFRTNGAPETGTAAEHMTTWTEITAEGFPPPTGSGSNQTAVPLPILPLDGPFWLEVFKNKIYIAVEQGGHGEDARGQIWVYEPNDVPEFALTGITSCAAPGEQVILTGSGFDDYQQDSSVRLADQPVGDVVRWTDTEIVVTVPAGAASGPLTVYKDGMTTNPRQLTVAATAADCAGTPGDASEDPVPTPGDIPTDGEELPATGGGAAALSVLLVLGLLVGSWRGRRGSDGP